MRRASRWVGATAAVLMTTGLAGATVVERVVAVVGERAILLSDLRQRARPFLVRIEQQGLAGAQRAAATSQVYAQLLERMVNEELEQRAANHANITVTAQEVEDALGRVAAENGVTVERVVQEAMQSGLSERQYRQEIRRQLLEAKLLNLRVQGRLRVTEDDLRAMYADLVQQERARLPFRIAWIRIHAPRSAPEEELAQRRETAERLVQAARAGASFAELAEKHSSDETTRDKGGLLPRLQPGQLPQTLDRVVLSLDVGEISAPVRQGDDFVIVRLVERQESELPTFEDAKAQLSQRVYMDKMDHARQAWIDGLKRRTHIDIRL